MSDEMQETQEIQDEAFWDRIDEVVDLANQQTEHAESDDVSSSLLYATARFNAYLLASSAENADEIKAGKDSAVEYFTEKCQMSIERDCREGVSVYTGCISAD